MNSITLIFKRHRSLSKTRQEGFFMTAKRAFWFFAYLLKAVRVGIGFMKTEQLGSRVIHEGKIRFISNWSNSKAPTLSGDGFYRKDVPRSEIKNVLSIQEFWHRFMFGVDWYLINWHDIDVHSRLFK